MKNALIVIDMVKDFVEPDGSLYIGEHVNDTISTINELIISSLKKQDIIYFICTSYPKNHFKENFGEEIPHCVEGTIGREVTDRFVPIMLRNLQNVLYIPKVYKSGFRDNAFQHFINTVGAFDSYCICGVHTSTSILLTAVDMIHQGLNNVTVLLNAICDVLDEDHRAGIKVMENLGVGFSKWIPEKEE